MTPPDSGELCNATLGEDRVVYQCLRPKGHVGQHRDGNVTAWDQKPDSGEREVHPLCASCLQNLNAASPSCRYAVRHYVAPPPSVSLPLSLAHRILAALYAAGMGALADELRARLPTANPRKG